MAVGAKQDALPGLFAISGEGLASGSRDRKHLRRRIDVMKNEVHDAAVIATDRATAACLANQNALHLLETARHGLAYAPLA